jgi:HK97 family phage portal protein
MNLLQRTKLAFDVWLNGIKTMPNIYSLNGPESQFGLMDRKGDKRAMLQAYRSWVFACVDTRAKEIQAAEFRVLARTNQKESYEVELDHPLVALLNDPNPYLTTSELLYTTVVHMDLTGDCFWYTPRNGLGVPGEIWILPPDRVSIVPSKQNFISHYEVRNDNGDTMLFESDEIVHLRYPNPVDPYYGFSVLMAAAYLVDIDKFQHEYQREFYRNWAVPEFALKTEAKLDNDTRKRLQRDWQKNYSGGKNRGKIAILEAGLDITRLGVNPKELNWLAENKATMQTIAGMFKVPPSKLGQEDVPNRAVAEASDYSFSKNTIEPILRMLCERLTQDLARDFDERLVVQHVSTVRDDEERKARIRQINLQAGFTSRNEERRSEGLPDIAGGDEILVPTNFVPLSTVSKD